MLHTWSIEALCGPARSYHFLILLLGLLRNNERHGKVTGFQTIFNTIGGPRIQYTLKCGDTETKNLSTRLFLFL